MRRRPSRSSLVAALVPWLWFAIRSMSPWMEVVAVLLPLVGLTALGIAALTFLSDRLRLLRVLALSTVVMAAAAFALPRIPTGRVDSDVEIVVAAANLTGDNRDAGLAVNRLMAENPDILVLEETNPHSRRRFPNIMAGLPYAAGSDALDSAQTVVFSRYPLTPIDIPADVDNGRIVAVEVEGPERFVVVGAHLPRPWFQTNDVERLPAERHQLIVSLAAWLAEVDLPVILAGDLNSTDRGLDYRTLRTNGELGDGMRSTWAATTSTKWWPLLLRIDHILVRGFCPVSSTNTALPGSDHHSVIAGLASCG